METTIIVLLSLSIILSWIEIINNHNKINEVIRACNKLAEINEQKNKEIK